MQIVEKCPPITLIKRPVIIHSESVKECLCPPEPDKWEEVWMNIKKILYDKSNKNEEVGETRYHRPNLPSHIDPATYVFGKSCGPSFGVKETITAEAVPYACSGQQSIERPWAQTTRNYKPPFDKSSKFGYDTKTDIWGHKLRKLVHWYKGPVDGPPMADPLIWSQPRVPPVPNHELNPKRDGVAKILKECPINPKVFLKKTCIAYLNHTRLQIKKRGNAVNFFVLKEHIMCLNKEKGEPESCTICLELFYKILRIVRISPDRELFEYILRDLNLITEDNQVYFCQALNVLDWRQPMPVLSDIKDLTEDCLYFKTTYKEMMKPYEVKRPVIVKKLVDQLVLE